MNGMPRRSGEGAHEQRKEWTAARMKRGGRSRFLLVTLRHSLTSWVAGAGLPETFAPLGDAQWQERAEVGQRWVLLLCTWKTLIVTG